MSTKELRNVTKESLRVLDIEPYFSPVFDACASNNYTTSWTELGRVYNNNTKDAINLKIDREHSRDIFSIDWFKSNVGASTENIALDGIGIKEFIGRVDDLCSGYDLIYIGLDTAYMNTDTTTDKNVRYKGKNTKFNDTSLNGKVYYHVGDKIKANQPSTNDLLSAANSYTNITDEGIDITPDKLRDLQNYVRAGYAIILSNDFFEKNSDGSFKKTNGKLTINKVKVDEWSYMYDFVYWCINDEGNWINKNVSVAANFDAKVTPNGKDNITNAEEFTKYINVQKLYIDEATYEHPVYYYPEREDMQEYEYIPINDNGVYSLDYKIKLVNDSAVDTSNTTYDCVLYLDIDGDGRYEDNDIERQDGLIITEDGSADVIGQDSSKRYNLVAGKTYRISRTIPEGYVGFLSWKIVFYENKANGEANDVTDTLIRVAKQGYSAVPDYTQQPTIDVLQIVPYYFPYTNGVTLDMSENGQLYDYYKNLKDFKLNVTVVKSNEFISNIWNKAPQNIKINPNYLAEQYYNELCKYDMVAMGFTDVFYWPNGEAGTGCIAGEAATMAIRKYVLKGRSMLFTHDLNSSGFTSQYDSWGYLFNMYLRDVQGMDRYGILSKSGYVQNKFNTTYNTFLTDVDDNGNTTKLEYVSMYDIPDCEDPNQTEYPVRKGIAVRPYSTIGYNRWLRLESPFTINLAKCSAGFINILKHMKETKEPFKVL